MFGRGFGDVGFSSGLWLLGPGSGSSNVSSSCSGPSSSAKSSSWSFSPCSFCVGVVEWGDVGEGVSSSMSWSCEENTRCDTLRRNRWVVEGEGVETVGKLCLSEDDL
jgi:hypothetical protein